MRTSWPALTHSSASVPPILPAPMMPILSGAASAARPLPGTAMMARTAQRLAFAIDDMHPPPGSGRQRYIDTRLEIRLSTGKAEEVDGRIGQDRCAGGQGIEPLPPVADPDRSRRDAVGDMGASAHLAAPVEDADAVALGDSTGPGVCQRDPQARLRIGAGQRRERAAPIVEGVAMRQR